MTLRSGQYQLGDVVFGNGTLIPVSGVEHGGYGIQAGDYAVVNSDELRFGKDYIQPGTLVFEFAVMDNKPIWDIMQPGDVAPHDRSARQMLERLQAEWLDDDIRLEWGEVKPLRYCLDGEIRRYYGRPRKFVYSHKSMKSEWINVTADYQRVDNLTYSDDESMVIVLPSAEGTTTEEINRELGSANAWFQAFIEGPIVNPKLKIGNFSIDITFNLAQGKLIQVSTYPWERRIVNSDGQNLAPVAGGTTPYLNEIKIPPYQTTRVGLSGTGTNSNTKAYVLWREAYRTF